GVTSAELEALACFAHGSEVPAEVIQRVSTDEAIAELLRRRLLEASPTVFQLTRAGLGAAALDRLDPLDRSTLFGRLGAAWAPLSEPWAVLYRCWMGRLDSETTVAALDTIFRLEPDTDPRLADALAEIVAAAPPERQRAGDWIALMRVRDCARQLPGAVEAFWKAWRAERYTEDDLVTLVRWRWFLSQLTGDPALGLPTPAELARLATLKSHHTFEGLVLAARSAVMLGATEQARRLLDQAQQMSRSARLKDRALWRLVHGELQVRSGHPIRPEALRELVTRWCDLTDRDSWYDDVLAVRALIAAEAYEDAQQFLLTVEAAYAAVGGHAAAFLLTVRLEVELASFSMSSALATAEQLRTTPTGGVVHLHGLGADLIRAEALGGVDDGTFGHLRERVCLTDELRLARELGYQHLIAGRYADAVFQLESALRDDRTLTEAQRWEVLADLVEAHLATGNRAGAEEAGRSAPTSSPTSPRAAAPASRCRALLAPPIETRNAFAEALEQTSHGLPWIYRGRTLLAYARRLSQLGGTDEATALRQEAAALFRHHGLLGWQRHAEQLRFTDVDSPRQRPRLHDRLDVTETQIVRLVLSGRKNKEVASELYMSLRTLEKALTRIYRKLQVATKAEMNVVLSADEVAGFSTTDSPEVEAHQVRPDPAPFPPAAERGPSVVPPSAPASLTSSP
ncbi:MAG: LuxR C-terminal-related transcriptional regulator, partial [Propionibacteriaceae bacterium]